MDKIIKIQTSHAVLLLQDEYVLQLRDNKTTIAAPGQWSLFGGRKGEEETPIQAIKREIFEELSIRPSEFRYLWHKDYYDDFFDGLVRTWFFEADVSLLWSQHKLNEGKEAKSFKYEEIAGLKIPLVMQETIGRHYFERQKQKKEIKNG